MLFGQGGESGGSVALVGGTVLDVSDFGRSTRDLTNAMVLIRGGKIVAVDTRGKVVVPKDARVVDAAGKFIVPGLVDGFAGLNSQRQANAHLYMGVTTVAASADDRRGELFLSANPSPHVYLLDGTGSSDDFDLLGSRPEWKAKLKGHDPDIELSWEDNGRMMDEQSRMGVRGLWLGHNLTSANTRRILTKARELGMATYGEFVATSYSEAIGEGVSLLLHMTRYELGMIPDEMQRGLAADPEGPGAAKAYAFVDEIAPTDPRVAEYGRRIAANHVALMPTFSIYYVELPEHRNLWKEPVAKILDPKGMFHPTDPATGERVYKSEQGRQQLEKMISHTWELNRVMCREHPRYLAATGSAVFDSMPGISMHTEMELLVRLGLTAREALAAATGNYSEQLGWHELGMVAPGRRADLLVLDANPLEDIRNTTRISSVLLEGKIVDRAALLAH